MSRILVPTNSAYIDLNLQEVAKQINKVCGLIPETEDELMKAAPAESYSSYTPIIPRSEWDARAALINPRLRKCVRNRKNQRNEGSCVFNAITGQWEFVAATQFGWDKDFVILSAIYGYCKYGSSPGSGSMVSDAVKFMMNEGCIPETGHGYTYPFQFAPTGFYEARDYRRANPGCLEFAKNFMSLEYYRVQGVMEWATALLNGHPIIKGRSGHSIYDFIWEKASNGRWFAGYMNSWGDWGDFVNDVIGNGLGWDSESFIDQQGTGYALVGVKLRDEIGNQIIQPTVAI